MLQILYPHTFGFVTYAAPVGSEMLADPSFDLPLDPSRWRATSNWTISNGKAINSGNDTAIYQDFNLLANTTYEAIVEVESLDGGGAAFQFLNPDNGAGFGWSPYTKLKGGVNAFTVTPTTNVSARFAIKGNYGAAVITSSSLKQQVAAARMHSSEFEDQFE